MKITHMVNLQHIMDQDSYLGPSAYSESQASSDERVCTTCSMDYPCSGVGVQRLTAGNAPVLKVFHRQCLDAGGHQQNRDSFLHDGC